MQARGAVVVVVVVTEVVPAGSPDYFFLFVGKVYLVCSTKKIPAEAISLQARHAVVVVVVVEVVPAGSPDYGIPFL